MRGYEESLISVPGVQCSYKEALPKSWAQDSRDKNPTVEPALAGDKPWERHFDTSFDTP